MRVLDRLDTPAQVTSDLGVVLRQNPLAEALLGDLTGRNIIAALVHRPGRPRALSAGRSRPVSRSYVAHLRAVHSRRDDDVEARALVEELRASPEFAELWERHEVARPRRHPQAHPAPARRA